MVHLLRVYYGKHPTIWDEQLSYVQHAYNWEIHSSTHKTPFEICLGYLPQSPLDLDFKEKGEENGQNDS